MKKLSLITLAFSLCLWLSPACHSGNNGDYSREPHFSEGVELISLVFRLAGAEEYTMCRTKAVNESADAWFAPMKDHKAVQLAKQYHQIGASYDAVAAYGFHLVISDEGKIRFNPDFVERSDDSFLRWTRPQRKKMLAALNDFYRKSHFHEWYLSQEPLRRKAIDSFKSKCEIGQAWFDSFFGPSKNLSFQIILSFLVGPNNYGTNVDLSNGRKLVSPVIGCMDEEGTFGLDGLNAAGLVVHEYCHAFCNPLVDRFWDSMADKAKTIYEEVSGPMERNAYGEAKIMMYETLVRSSVIPYIASHFDSSYKEPLISSEEAQGFLLVKPIVETLEKKNRDQYPTMADFMPEIIGAINSFEIQEHSGQYDEYTVTATGDLLPGVFSVGQDRKVQFTKGNLYWDGSQWQFEDNQMNVPVSWNPGHISHFYWCTNAGAARAEKYDAPGASTEDHFFCDGSDEDHFLTVAGLSRLRVLSDCDQGEVGYLLEQRQNADRLHRFPVNIEGVGSCLVIAPDDYSGTIAGSYDPSSWAVAQTEGLVCFAPCGIRDGSSLEQPGMCAYWPGTPHSDDADCAYMLGAIGSDVVHYTTFASRCYGLAIRLIKDVTE